MRPTQSDVYFNRLKALLKQGMIELGPKLIFQQANGDYLVHNAYTVHHDRFGYTVTRLRDETRYHFNRLRTAVAWSIYNSRDYVVESQKIQELDRRIGTADIELAQCKAMAPRSDPDRRAVAEIKAAELQQKIRQFQTELDKYITTARQWQQKELENATKRNEHR